MPNPLTNANSITTVLGSLLYSQPRSVRLKGSTPF
jgi:hypothetical protein